jgi:hypothetical protein
MKIAITRTYDVDTLMECERCGIWLVLSERNILCEECVQQLKNLGNGDE